MSEERQHGTPCITLNCPNRVGQGMFVGDLCSPCHSYLTTMSGRYSQLYRNTRRESVVCSYDKFLDALEKNAMYETMYEDSEGRMILVITPLDLYSFVNRLWRERSDE
jgi:hypothetical protein